MGHLNDRAGCRRVVLFTEMYHPETISTAYYLTEIARGLAAEFEVEVITARLAAAQDDRLDVDRDAGITVCRVANSGANKANLIARIWAACCFSLAAFWAGLRRVRGGDVVLAVTNPPLLPYVARLVAMFKSGHYLLLVHDVYPNVLAAAGLIRRSSVLYWVLERVSGWLARSATRVILLGRDMEVLFRGKGCRVERLTVIPNWAESAVIPVLPKRGNQWLAELGYQDEFVMLYAGNSGRTHDLDVIIDAARLLRTEQGLRFLIAGFGRRLEELRGAVENEGLTNVSIVPFAFPRKDQVQTLSAGDVALISFVPGMAGVSVPSRMYNIMAAGRPIIGVTDAESELAQVIREEAIGWVVKPGDARGLADAILDARNYPERTLEMGARAARVARAKYPLTGAMDCYRAAVRAVATESW